ncbi:MAG: diphosphatase [Enterovirga sp.]|nr:diphosphatase [Enterovirga sp.]
MQNAVQRAGVETDPDALLRDAEAEGGLRVVVAGEQAILREENGRLTALHSGNGAGFGPVLERVVLGRLDGRPVLAASYDPDAATAPGVQASDLRSIAIQGLVAPAELGMLAQAKSLLGWHARHRFCAHCGSPTASASAGLRRDCPACKTQHFPRTDPVSIMLVARGEFCLLGRQARFVPNSYSCLAGFISPGETIEDAVRREVLEEAGIRVGQVRYVASQPWPFPSSLMIGCICEATSQDITIDRDELEDARWFSRDEVALMLERRHPDGLITPPPMAIANHLMRAWLNGPARIEE